MEYFNIAIDGPAGAGKSTIAKLAAKRLGFVYGPAARWRLPSAMRTESSRLF